MDEQNNFFPTDRLNEPETEEELQTNEGRVIGMFNFDRGLVLQVGGDGFVMATPYVREDRVPELLDYFGARSAGDLIEKDVRVYSGRLLVYGIEKIGTTQHKFQAAPASHSSTYSQDHTS